MTSKDEFGPLPRADGSAELQRASFKAVQAVLPADEWIARDERCEDLGVDFSLELLASGLGTNFRAQVQLKGRSGLDRNADGSYSVAIPVTNLNYLLSGPTPLYVLYRPEDRRLLFTFAWDELRRIQTTTPNWRNQGDITLRFSEPFDRQNLSKIRDRVVQDTRGNRELREIAAVLAAGWHVQVDAATLKPRSPIEAEQILLQMGMMAIAQGLGPQVLDLCSALNARQFVTNPKLLLIRGYAEFSSGRYIQADPSLREALAASRALPPDDRHFLLFLVNAVELVQGHLSNVAFRERSEEWRAQAPPALAAQYELIHCWLLRSEATTEVDAERTGLALRRAIASVKAIHPAASPVSQYSETLELFLDAQDLVFALSEVLVLSDPMIFQLRFGAPREVVVPARTAKIDLWRARASALMAAISASGNSVRYCEMRYTLDLCEEMLLGHVHMTRTIMGQTAPEVPGWLLDRVRATQRIAADHGQTEIELRAALVECHLEDLKGNQEGVRKIASEVHRRAVALRFADIARVADRTLNVGGMHSVRTREIEAKRADDFDSFFLEMTQEQQGEHALEACKMLNLPIDRVPIILDGLRREVASAKERSSWCRHLRVLERDDGQAVAGPFARKPECCCKCDRFGHKSLVTNVEWTSVIAAFKRVGCAACDARSPRREASTGL